MPEALATIARMGKKRKEDPHKGVQINLRVPDERLLEAIAAFGLIVRQKRTMSIVILLERALEAEGLWPPPSPQRPCTGPKE